VVCNFCTLSCARFGANAFEAGFSDGHELETAVTRKHKEVSFLLFGVGEAERAACGNGWWRKMRNRRSASAAHMGNVTNGKPPSKMQEAKGRHRGAWQRRISRERGNALN
jgi:hypothetical protein